MLIRPIYEKISVSDLAKYSKDFEKNDEEILCDAKKYSDLKSKNNFIANARKILPYVAAGAMATTAGIQTPGKLSNKMMSASKVVGTYAAVDLIFNTLAGAKKYIDKKTGKENKENNGILEPLMIIGGGFIGIQLLLGGFKKMSEKLIEKKPKFIMDMTKKVKDGFELFDKTKFASKIQNFKTVYSEFAKKHPKITSKISKNAFPIILGSYIAGDMALALKSRQRKEHDFAKNVTSDVIKREYARQMLETPVIEVKKV